VSSNVTNIFQGGSAGFKVMMDVKRMHQGYVSIYVRNVDLITLSHKCNYKELEEKKNDGNRRT
jgi:hypothetical protein